MNLEQRIARLELAYKCLRCSKNGGSAFEGITPTFTTLTSEDIGATPTSTIEEIQQLLADYIAANPITIGSNEIRYIQVDGNTYILANTAPGTITTVAPTDIIPLGITNGSLGVWTPTTEGIFTQEFTSEFA